MASAGCVAAAVGLISKSRIGQWEYWRGIIEWLLLLSKVQSICLEGQMRLPLEVEEDLERTRKLLGALVGLIKKQSSDSK